MYKILYHKRALKQLQKLPKQDQIKIISAINRLQDNPMNFKLNIRPYYNTVRSWRIRTGNLRAIYTFDTKKEIIFIEYLGYRGSVYKKR